MADDGDRNEVNWVAEYKLILLRVLDLRPSGMRHVFQVSRIRP